MCCSVLQCVAVCCSLLRGVVVCCSVLQCAAVLLYMAVMGWQRFVSSTNLWVCCSALQCVAGWCREYCCHLPTMIRTLDQSRGLFEDCVGGLNRKKDILPHIATQCNTLQYTATPVLCRANSQKRPDYIFLSAQFSMCLQITATRCNSLQLAATHGNSQQPTANHLNSLQLAATYYNWLQPTSSRCVTVRLSVSLSLSLSRTHTSAQTPACAQTVVAAGRMSETLDILHHCRRKRQRLIGGRFLPQRANAGGEARAATTWLIHTCDMTHSHVGRDACIRATYMYTRNMACSQVRHDSFSCRPWRMYTRDIYVYVQHGVFTGATWRIHMLDLKKVCT